MAVDLEQIAKETFTPLRITDYALEKGNLIAREVKNICDQFNLPTYEVAFYLLTSKEEAKKEQPLITDIYIAHDQDVKKDFCNINGMGNVRSLRDIIKRQGLRIAGLGHSHGDLANFFSSRDVQTFNRFVKDHRLQNNISREEERTEPTTFINEGGTAYLQIGGTEHIRVTHPLFNSYTMEQLNKKTARAINHYEAQTHHSYALVFNARNEKPHAVIGYAFNQQTVQLHEHISLAIIPVRKEVTQEQGNIERQLYERVNQFGNQLKKTKKQYVKDAIIARKHLKQADSLVSESFNKQGQPAYKPLLLIAKHVNAVEEMLQLYEKKHHPYAEKFKTLIQENLSQFAEHFSVHQEPVNDLLNQTSVACKQQRFWPINYFPESIALVHKRDFCNTLISVMETYGGKKDDRD